MPLNLLLDTTRDTMMLALANETGIIAECSEESSASHRYHSSILLPRIKTLLGEQNKTPADLTGVGVNQGPGSFTGIRTGLTLARLLGQFLPLQLYGFNSFELIAGAAIYRGEAVTILLNAFRQQHYHASLTVSPTGEITWHNKPEVCPNDGCFEIKTPWCLVDPSLVEKLDIQHTAPTPLDDAVLCTPAVMAFYLQHHTDAYRASWQDLQPMYLQQPHITQPKASPVH